MPPCRARLRPVLAALLGLNAQAVLANDQDPLQLSISTSLSFDSNLFRQPASAARSTEQIQVTQVELSYEKEIGQQKLKMSTSLVDNHYDKNSYLDNTAHNYKASLDWAAGSLLKGVVKAERTQALTSFSAFDISTTRNIRTQDTRQLRAEWLITGGWSLVGGVSESVLKNSSTDFNLDPDHRELTPEIGLRRSEASGAFVEVTHREANGEFTSRSAPDPALRLDTGYVQTEDGVSFGWPFSSKLQAQGRVAHVSRRHDHYAERDFSGTTLQLDTSWQATGKLAVVASLRQGLSGYTATDASYYQSRTLLLSPTWQITPKTALRLNLLRENRDYRGSPTPGTGGREDVVRIAGLALDWRPQSAFLLSAGFQREERDSNQAAQDYSANVGLVSASLRF